MSRKGVSGRFVGEPDFRIQGGRYDSVQGSIRGSKIELLDFTRSGSESFRRVESRGGKHFDVRRVFRVFAH